MPRRARLAVPGIPLHIIQRGNNRSACFYAEKDYRFYLETLRDQAQTHRCAIPAYVLMTNHVHLLLTPERQESAASLMKHLDLLSRATLCAIREPDVWRSASFGNRGMSLTIFPTIFFLLRQDSDRHFKRLQFRSSRPLTSS